MADPTRSDSDFPENLPEDYQEVPAPDPHRGEPVPPANEGIRPEADPSVVRPDEDEPNGPIAELVEGASAEIKEEATPGGDPEAEALLAQMGVEEEGIEAGQLLGLVAATVAAIIALAVVLIYLFYVPFKTQVVEDAESAARPTDLEAVRTDAAAKLGQYTRSDSTYTVPISRAMGLVAAQYDTGERNEATAMTPTSNAQWNTLMVMRGAGRAVQSVEPSGTTPAVSQAGTLDSARVAPALEPPTGEEVGVDESEEVIPDDN